MPQIYKIALLEDNKKQLSKLVQYLQQIPNAEVVLESRNSDDFFEQLQTVKPDILITDLDLGNDSMTGMEVAQELKIPVFFASINTADYIENIEHLKREADLCVDHITKPYNEEQFSKGFRRFLKEVKLFSEFNHVYLNFDKKKHHKVSIDDIVYLCADKLAGAESNNKQIFFINRKSEILVDFSFSKMESKGLLKEQFVTIHKSFRVNKKHIICYHPKKAVLEIKVYDHDHKIKIERLPVSETYQKEIKMILR